jgi:hypothetical protein
VADEATPHAADHRAPHDGADLVGRRMFLRALARWGCTSRIQLTHTLESAWFQPLNLKRENLVSSLCFSQMQRVALHRGGEMAFASNASAAAAAAVGLCTLNQFDP